MTRDETKKILIDSLIRLWKMDKALIMGVVKEECINHRLAKYIEELLSLREDIEKDIRVDVEYDKHHESPKTLNNIVIRPDIIVHRRGNDSFNLLFIEAKKGYSNKNDREKVYNIINDEFGYNYGFLVSFLPNRAFFRFVIIDRNGEEIVRVPKTADES
jgi:nitrogen regulatory protein PII-like uncharacterized protein